MAHDEDLPEYMGTAQTIKADPKGKRAAAAPRVAIYTPPAKGASHPKHAVLGPALRLDAAEAGLDSAQAELTAATAALRAIEVKEADALSALMAAMPAPTPDELLRQHAANQSASRAARVAAGERPEAPQVSRIGNSPLDIAAAQRPRTSQHAPNAPLRSPVVRRTV
jgi:hypothetical protein